MYTVFKSVLKRSVILFSTALMVLSPLAGTQIAHAAGPTITIDGSQKFQTMDGMGYNINPDSWDNGALRPVLDSLIDENGAKTFRIIMEMQDWEQTNDNSDPNTYNWAYYDPIYSGATTFDTAQSGTNFANLWNTIDYLHSKGIPDSQIILSNMGPGPSWNGGSFIGTQAQINEWVEEVTSAAYWGYSRGHTFGMFSPNNEMDITSNEGITMNSAQYANGLAQIAQRMDGLGMTNVRLIGPDTTNPDGALQDYGGAMKSNATVMAKMDHFGFHSYFGTTGVINSLTSGTNKNFWVTEFTDFEDTFKLLQQNASGIMVWEAYDSIYNHAIVNGRGNQPGNDDEFGTAPLAYNATTKAYTPRQNFYQFEQLYKYVPVNSVRIAANSTDSTIATVAFTHAASGRFTLVGDNTSSTAKTVSVSLANIPNLPPSLSYFQTNASSKMAQGADVNISAGTATVTIPANTTFTLTNTVAPDTTAPSAPTALNATGATGSAGLSWGAATDNIGIAQYNVYRSTTPGFTPNSTNKVGTTATTSFNNTGLATGTYYYLVTAQDAAGNESGASNEASAVVTSDTTAPTITLTNPANNATVSATVNIAATATDNTGVAGVQFKLDGANLGAEDTTSPYSLSWDTATATNGTHTLTAIARDASGNTTTSASVTVTVSNAGGVLLLGNNTIQSTADSNASGEAEGFKYTAVASGTASTVSFYVDSGSAATSLKVGLYSDNAGHPGTLLASGTLNAPKSAAWNTVPLGAGTTLLGGGTYWIGFVGTGGQLKYRDTSSGSCSEAYSTTGLSALPATWSSGQTWQSCNLSAYVTSAASADTIAPSTTVTSPANNATIGGTTSITTTATDNTGVSKVELYVDGVLNSTLTANPYNFSLATTALSNGSHQLNTKAYDAAGNVGTSPVVTVTVFNDTVAPTVPTGLTATSTGMTTTTVTWTASTDNTGVTGYKIFRGGTQIGTSTTTSYNDSGLAGGTAYSYTVLAYDAAGNNSAQSSTVTATTDTDTTPPSIPTGLSQTGATATTASLAWSSANDNIGVTGYTYYANGAVQGTTNGTSVTFTGLACSTSLPVSVDAFDAAGNHSAQATALLTTQGCDTTAPTVSISAPASGANVSGTVNINATATDNVSVAGVQYKLDGTNLGNEDTSAPYSVSWNTATATNGTHSLTAIARDSSGNVSTSAAVTVTVNNATGTITLDKQVTTHQTTKGATIVSPSLSTAQPNELLVAFISSDGPSAGGQTFSTVTGGGLTWTLRKRTNTSLGTSEIWTAAAPSVVTNITVTATRSKTPYAGSMTVAAFQNANLTSTGSVGGAAGTTGAPTASLVATQNGSIVWGVGNDWDGSTARTVGSGQTIIDQYLASNFGDTFWVQKVNSANMAGQTVSLSDSAPANHQWNLALIEILPAN